MEIEVKYAGGRRLETEIRGHKIAFDVAEEHGGANSAPEPPETFTAAVAACIGMYALGFLSRKELKTEGFRIEATAEMAEDPKRLSVMNFKIHLPQSVPSKRKKQFRTTVEKCPLTGTLSVLPQMNIEIIEPENS
ncbi:MAG: OsmC family protein [Planctomycetota bacterium]|jgi:uncharacterized OsmC-like protein